MNVIKKSLRNICDILFTGKLIFSLSHSKRSRQPIWLPFRVDLCHATANLTKPQFQTHAPLPLYYTIEEEVLLQSTLNRKWGAEYPESPIKQYDGMDAAVAKLFHRLRQLSVLNCGRFSEPWISLTTVYRPDDAFRTTSPRLVHALEQHSTIWFRQPTESICSGAGLLKDVAYNDPHIFISSNAQNTSWVSSFGEAGSQIQDFVAKLDERGNVDPLPTKAAYVGLIYCWH
jgi:hypothetical protein